LILKDLTSFLQISSLSLYFLLREKKKEKEKKEEKRSINLEQEKISSVKVIFTHLV